MAGMLAQEVLSSCEESECEQRHFPKKDAINLPTPGLPCLEQPSQPFQGAPESQLVTGREN